MKNTALIVVTVFLFGCSSEVFNEQGLCEGAKNYEDVSMSIQSSEAAGKKMYSVIATFLKYKDGKELREIAFLKGKPPYMVIRVGALESESSDHVDAVIFLDKQHLSSDNCFRPTYVGNGPDGERQYSAQYVSFGRISEPE